MKNIDEQSYIESPVYSIEISRDPITGKKRLVESPELSINSWAVFLQCTIFYLNEDGSKIESERLKSYQFRLSADNKPSGPWVNPLTGERYDITEETIEEEGEEKVIMVVPDNAVLRYTFLISLFNSGTPIDIKAMVESFVANADEAGEFDI